MCSKWNNQLWRPPLVHRRLKRAEEQNKRIGSLAAENDDTLSLITKPTTITTHNIRYNTARIATNYPVILLLLLLSFLLLVWRCKYDVATYVHGSEGNFFRKSFQQQRQIELESRRKSRSERFLTESRWSDEQQVQTTSLRLLLRINAPWYYDGHMP